MLLPLVLALSLQQDPAVLDTAVYASSEWGILLPRPFDDWVFAPATSRGTTTVIFQPRNGTLADQLWGALILSPWGRPVPLGSVTDQRITTTWRSTLGAEFRLLARDSLEIAGLPAMHIVMSGTIGRLTVDVEEYLLARDSDLIALQFRYPGGVSRDSIAAGYLRALAGLRVRAPARAPAMARRRSATWDVAIDNGGLVFDLPMEYRAVAPGWLSSEATAAGRRTMRWRPVVGAADTALYAVGRFRMESRRAGRLTLRIWRNLSTDSSVARVTDTIVARVAEAWAAYWRSLGPVPTAEVALVETSWPRTRGAAATLYIGADAGPAAGAYPLRRELARTWWGGAVRAEGPAERLIGEVLPAWSTELVASDSIRRPDAALQSVISARRIAGEAAFREAIRTLIVESRGTTPALASFLTVLGPQAAAELRPLLREQNR